MNLKSQMLTLAILGALGDATAAEAQTVDCQSAEFSSQVLERFPRIREACLKVVDRDGTQFALFTASVTRVRNNGVNVRFKLPDGSKSEVRSIQTKPEFRVIVEGTPTRVRDLVVGQELTALVSVREPEPVIALEPAEEAEPLQLASLDAPEAATEPPTAAVMPATASMIPAIGLAGALLTALAAGMTLLRRRVRRV